jgi:hypothetical protein
MAMMIAPDAVCTCDSDKKRPFPEKKSVKLLLKRTYRNIKAEARGYASPVLKSLQIPAGAD